VAPQEPARLEAIRKIHGSGVAAGDLRIVFQALELAEYNDLVNAIVPATRTAASPGMCSTSTAGSCRRRYVCPGWRRKSAGRCLKRNDAMPQVALPDGTPMHFRIDDFTDPWTLPDTVVLLHGFVRNSSFWYSWVPVLARHFRVVRPDLRGCGLTPPPPEGFPWSLARYHDDLIAFLDAAGIESAHFVGESMGGMVMPYIYSRSPFRVRSVVACSSNLGVKGVMAKEMAGGAANMTEAIATAATLEDYIRRTDGSRLAPAEVPSEARAWFAREWAGAGRRVWLDWSTHIVPQIDVSAGLLAGLKVPLLFIAPSRCVKLPPDEARFWVEHAPDARLEFVDAVSQALFFAKAVECSNLALDFLLGLRNRPAAG
jgi:3-oxoadipate enol-lactonase